MIMPREKLSPESCNNISTMLYAAGVGLLLLISLLTCGCNAAKRLRRIDANHPLTSAQFYAERYPVKESTEVHVDTVTDIQYMPPEILTVDCDSAIKYRTTDTGKLLVYVPCPEQKVITRLVTKDSIVRIENIAALTAARLETKAAQDKLDACVKWRNRFAWASGIGWFLIIGTIAIRFLKPRWL